MIHITHDTIMKNIDIDHKWLNEISLYKLI